MSDSDLARMLLLKATQDLTALQGMKNKSVFVEEIFGFHAQQAVEKSLKAWLAFIGAEFPKIHDLEELFALLLDHKQDVSEAFSSLIDLTDFSVQFRYDAFEDFEENLDRDDMIRRVEVLVSFVKDLINVDDQNLGEGNA